MKIIPMDTGDENDALSRRSKRFYNWDAGIRKYVKRLHNRKIRRYFQRIDEAEKAAGVAKAIADT